MSDLFNEFADQFSPKQNTNKPKPVTNSETVLRNGEELIRSYKEMGFMPVDAEGKLKGWVGIDPGKNGGIILLDSYNQISKWVMPKIGDDVDIHELHRILSDIRNTHNITIILEEVHSIFGTSAGSNFTFGFVCGAIEAIVISHHLKLIKIQPKAWQKEIWLTSEVEYKAPKKPKKGEEAKKPSNRKTVDTKLTSLKACKRLFPQIDLRATDRSFKQHDGLVDGLLIAEYGRRNNL